MPNDFLMLQTSGNTGLHICIWEGHARCGPESPGSLHLLTYSDFEELLTRRIAVNFNLRKRMAELMRCFILYAPHIADQQSTF